MSAGDDGEYDDYMRHRTNLSSVLALFSGFSSTAIAILVTRLQNPSSIESQSLLFLLVTTLDVSLFLLGYNTIDLIYLCRPIPPLARKHSAFSVLFYLVFVLFEVAVTAMFILWNLNYLALMSKIMLLSHSAALYFFVRKPF